MMISYTVAKEGLNGMEEPGRRSEESNVRRSGGRYQMRTAL